MTVLADDTGTSDLPALSRERMVSAALAEIALAFAEVDMKTMPQVPDDAPCRRAGADPEDWHDPTRKAAIPTVHERFVDKLAEDLCAGCPVLLECRRWAMDNPAQGGVLGGWTEVKRRRTRREQRVRPPRIA